MSPRSERLLVIGLDSAETALVERLMADGRMPALSELDRRGRWVDVRSHANLAGAVTWPSFVTGTRPEHHGIYNEWAWDPKTMTVRRPDLSSLVPFWSALAKAGVSVGTLDVPLAPLVGLDDGFEVSEWGAHDRMTGRLTFGPSTIAPVIERHPRHPYGRHLPRSDDPADVTAVAHISATARDGLKLRGALARDLIRTRRPQLSIVVFTELHDAGHHLWHTVEPDDPVYAGRDLHAFEISPSLAELYTAVDREIGLLIDEAGPDTSVLVLSLCGMRAGLGWPQLLAPLLERAGLLPSGGGERGVRSDPANIFAAIKRAAPTWAKRLYHQHADIETQIRLARSTMVPVHDWSRTKAFEAMRDHYGYCRLNVLGRERAGIVPLEEYDALRASIVEFGRALYADDGRQLVAEVIRPATPDGPLALALPDLVFHWTKEAELPPLPTIGGWRVPSPTAIGRTGHHQATGFCVAAGRVADDLGDPMETTGFAGVITALLS